MQIPYIIAKNVENGFFNETDSCYPIAVLTDTQWATRGHRSLTGTTWMLEACTLSIIDFHVNHREDPAGKRAKKYDDYGLFKASSGIFTSMIMYYNNNNVQCFHHTCIVSIILR